MILSNMAVKQLVDDGSITLSNQHPAETYGTAGLLLHIDRLFIPKNTDPLGIREINPTAQMVWSSEVLAGKSVTLVPLGRGQGTGVVAPCAVRVTMKERVVLPEGYCGYLEIAPAFANAFLSLSAPMIYPGIHAYIQATLVNQGRADVVLQRDFPCAVLVIAELTGSVNHEQLPAPRVPWPKPPDGEDHPPDFIRRARES